MGGHGFSPRFCPEAPVIGRVLLSTRDLRTANVKSAEEAMEILEAYDLTGLLRGAAALVGCDHKTVARLVAGREAAGGGLPVRASSRRLVDRFAEKIDEVVDRSAGFGVSTRGRALLPRTTPDSVQASQKVREEPDCAGCGGRVRNRVPRGAGHQALIRVSSGDRERHVSRALAVVSKILFVPFSDYGLPRRQGRDRRVRASVAAGRRSGVAGAQRGPSGGPS